MFFYSDFSGLHKCMSYSLVCHLNTSVIYLNIGIYVFRHGYAFHFFISQHIKFIFIRYFYFQLPFSIIFVWGAILYNTKKQMTISRLWLLLNKILEDAVSMSVTNSDLLRNYLLFNLNAVDWQLMGCIGLLHMSPIDLQHLKWTCALTMHMNSC